MNELTNVENLLNQTSSIIKKYDEYDQLTGDAYNVFNLLGLRIKEDAHSRVIYNLLNPKGSHKQGYIFLKLFIAELIKYFKNQEDENEDANKGSTIISKLEKIDFSDFIEVKREYYIGLVDKEFGGYIDIFIKIGDFKIAIENKVDAEDQYRQLVRYKKASDFVIYLTKDGKQPDDKSKGNLLEFSDYICVSYENNIHNWLENCIKETVNKPKIRETLNQYLETVRSFTGQSKKIIMQKEIINLFENQPKLISAGRELSKLFAENNSSIYTYVVREYILPKLKEIKDKYSFEVFEIEEDNFMKYDSNKRNKTIRFSIKGSKIKIVFKFESRKGYSDFLVGIAKSSIEDNFKETVLSSFKKYLKEDKLKESKIFYYYILNNLNINSVTIISILEDKGESYINNVENEVKKMIDFIQSLEKI